MSANLLFRFYYFGWFNGKGVTQTKILPTQFVIHRKHSVFILAISWIIGIISGLVIGFYFQDFIELDLGNLAEPRFSFFRRFATIIFPFLVSLAVVFLRIPSFIYLLAAGKGICFAYLFFCCASSFGSAGWLICFLLSFTSCVMQVPLLLFWFRYIDGNRQYIIRNTSLCLLLAAAVVSFDYFIISPYISNFL